VRIFISAGEASGDIHGGELIKELLKLDPQADITFLGGDLMAAAAGRAPLIHYRDMAFMGFSEVLRHLPTVLGNLRRAKAEITATHPDALILIDYPSFNLKLAAHAHSMGIPVYYYISPKVWAWKEWRIKKMRRYCRKILSILPFEVEYFNARGLEVEYVGNPSVEEVEARLATLPPAADFLSRHNLPTDKPLLALVPGSRVGEIRNNLPVMHAVAQQFPQFTPVIAGAPGIDRALYGNFSNYTVVDNATFELVHNADCALVTSGTATLETALLGTPQVVCYRSNGSKWARIAMSKVLKCPFVSLPNLIAGKEVVKELLLDGCTPENATAQLQRILPGTPGRITMLDGYRLMRQRLGTSRAAARAAASILHQPH
jgi:lipid-A-disaccharide synthase